MADTLGRLIIKELYSHKTSCGPDNFKDTYHPYVRDASSYTPGIPHIIPDVAFHPEVLVTIDFTHQFTVASEEIEGKRPVSQKILEATARKLRNFFAYYFQYAYTYGRRETTYSGLLTKILSGFASTNEKDFNFFVNSIVNFFVTSIAINRSAQDIGTCNITLRDNPNYQREHRTNIFFSSLAPILSQIFVPMLPIMVWAKGRLYKNWWFPIFDGYLMRAAPGDAAGFTSIDLSCKDTLELARISAEMINPAIIQVKEFRQQSAINIWSKPFYGLDHMDIFTTMVHGGKLIWDKKNFNTVTIDDPRMNSPYTLKFEGLGKFLESSEDSMVDPIERANDKGVHESEFSLDKALAKTSHIERPRRTVRWGYNITPYRIFNVSTPQVFVSDFASRLDVLRDVAGMVYYELYVDGWGDIQYHPMRLDNRYLLQDIIAGKDFVHNHSFPGAQVVGPEERINQGKNLNIEQLTTVLRLVGKDIVVNYEAAALELVGGYTDEPLMQRFGYRRQEISNDLFNVNLGIECRDGKKRKFLDLAAASLLKFMNGELYTSETTIVFRPELDIALPLYLTDTNEVFYVQGLTHTINIGGDATTTISCNFGRKDDEPAPDLASYMIATEQMYKLNGNVYVAEATAQTRYEKRFDISPLPFGGDVWPYKTERTQEERAELYEHVMEAFSESSDKVREEREERSLDGMKEQLEQGEQRKIDAERDRLMKTLPTVPTESWTPPGLE